MDSTDKPCANAQPISLPQQQMLALTAALAVSYPNLFNLPQLQQLSPAALAYIGDAVYELYIRTRFLIPPQRLQAYHQQVVAQVRAERQAEQLNLLRPYLNEFEQDLLRRGRNAASGRPKRVDPEVYQQATALEALLGHLYLSDPQRLMQLLEHLQLETQPAPEAEI